MPQGRRTMITVVNMIPKSLSNEERQDSEPNLTVSSADPTQMAASAFTPDPGSSGNAPIYVSTDGGNTWDLRSVVPGNLAGFGTHDITLRFDDAGKVLFVADLRGDKSSPT